MNSRIPPMRPEFMESLLSLNLIAQYWFVGEWMLEVYIQINLGKSIPDAWIHSKIKEAVHLDEVLQELELMLSVAHNENR